MKTLGNFLQKFSLEALLGKNGPNKRTTKSVSQCALTNFYVKSETVTKTEENIKVIKTNEIFHAHTPR